MEETLLNLPNFVPLPDMHWVLGSLSLTVAYAACFGFAVYFILTSLALAPRYKLVAILSSVVMVSAGLSLMREGVMWDRAYTWDPLQALHIPMTDGNTFSNAYRYGNWTITVPLLLTQLPLALGITGKALFSRALRMGLAGVLMIWTGLIGQFGEVADFTLLNGCRRAAVHFYDGRHYDQADLWRDPVALLPASLCIGWPCPRDRGAEPGARQDRIKKPPRVGAAFMFRCRLAYELSSGKVIAELRFCRTSRALNVRASVPRAARPVSRPNFTSAVARYLVTSRTLKSSKNGS